MIKIKENISLQRAQWLRECSECPKKSFLQCNKTKSLIDAISMLKDCRAFKENLIPYLDSTNLFTERNFKIIIKIIKIT